MADSLRGAEGNEKAPSVAITGNVLSNDTDVDSVHSDFTVTTPGTSVGTYDALTLNTDGSYSYAINDANTVVDALNVGSSLSESFNYTMSDNNSNDPKVASNALTITIQGTNDAPIALADTASGAEGNETVPSVVITGNVLTNDTDVDSSGSAFSVTTVGVFVGI